MRDVEREIGPLLDGMTLDRVDNDGHYEPGNLRWATRRQQATNRAKKQLPKPRAASRRQRQKITGEQVLQIQERWASGESQTAIGKDLGLSQAHVSRIVRGI